MYHKSVIELLRLLPMTILLTLASALALAQQKPQYTQYVFNNMLLNPAVSGIENYTEVKTGYRSQWTGLDGAPVTSFITVNMPIGQKFLQGDATAVLVAGGNNPYSRSYANDYMAAENHHGIGLTVVNDRTGPITQTAINAAYAYHIGLAPKLNLAVGISAGINSFDLNRSLIDLGDATLDPAIANGNVNQIRPDLGAGLWLYGARYYVGASVQQLLKQNLNFTSGSTYSSQLVPHYFLTAGVKLFLSDDISMLPSVLVKSIKPAPVTFDVNTKFTFRDTFWIGGSYRRGDSFAATTGFNISSVINVGYSYDFTSSSLNTVSNGSHEIVIGILIGNKYKVKCPMRSY